MALQDLTPQLRTRLSRVERAVGWFVLLASAILVFGFGYYVYHTAQRKGWFLTKARYFTYTDRATGLTVGDPVMLMGFEVGRITRIDSMPADSIYAVYVEFEIKDPYYGYLWTDGSRAKVATAYPWGKRVLEVTKGTGGCPVYMFHPLREMTLEQALQLAAPEKWQLAEDIYDASGIQIAVHALSPLTRSNLAVMAALGHTQIRVFDTLEKRKVMTAVWDDKEGRYKPYTKNTPPYWLRSDETPAVTERLEILVGQIEKALPDILNLTNQLGVVLGNTANLASNLNLVAHEAHPTLTNLAWLSAQWRTRGALGEWLLPTNLQEKLELAVSHADAAIVRADTNLTALMENLGRSLDHLASITSNLNHQVQLNTNILSEISAAVVHTDELVQGLKRHWLLRSAFRPKTNLPPAPSPSRLRSPRDTEAR